MSLPTHSYFSLKQAANRAKCEIEDLIHFAAIGLLELCVKLPEYGFHSEEQDDNGITTWTSIDLDVESQYDRPSKEKEIDHIFCKYKSDNCYIEESFDLPNDKKNLMIIKGFLAVSKWDVYRSEDELTDNLLRTGYFSEFTVPRGYSAEITPGYKIHSIMLHDLLSFGIEKLYITKPEFDLLMQGGEQVDNHWIQGVQKQKADDFRISKNRERHASNREGLLKAAIFLLSKYPDECRGERKEISPEKWRDCLVEHRDEIPPLMINNPEVILKQLRSAVNGKGVE